MDSNVYFIVLISHILMSIAIVPMVLTTYLLGLGNQIQSNESGRVSRTPSDLRYLHGRRVLHDFTLYPW